MAKGGKPKKLQLPPSRFAGGKQTGNPDSLLPSAANSDVRICWRFTHLDNEGPWGLARLAPEKTQALITAMTQFESQTINQLFHQGEWPGKCHDVALIPNPDALARLEELGIPDMTKIWKLRIGGPGRLWGFLVDNVFHIVWWDPDHQIWPSKKKHT